MRANAKKMLNIVPNPLPMVEYFEAHFEELLKTAQKHAKQVLVVRQPWFAKKFTAKERRVLWNFGAGRPYVEEVSIYYTHRVVNELMKCIDNSATVISKQMGVQSLDLMPHMDRSFDSYYDYLHFTPKGARQVGELVAQAVLGHLPEVPETELEDEATQTDPGPSEPDQA